MTNSYTRKPIRFWSDRSFTSHQTQPVLMLHPFWNVPRPSDHVMDAGRLDMYYDNAQTIFEEVKKPDDADVLVCPVDYSTKGGHTTALKFEALAHKYNKRFILFFVSDSMLKLPFSRSIIFRTSFCKSRQQNNEFSIPGWSSDYIMEVYKGTLPIREKHERPVVGYCGYGYNWKRSPLIVIMWLLSLLEYRTLYFNPHTFRGNIL